MSRSPLISRSMKRVLSLALAAASFGSAEAQTIRNTATLSFTGSGGPQAIASNTVALDRQKRPSKISFRRLPEGFAIDPSKLLCEPDKGPRATPQPITAAELARAQPLASLDIDNPLIIVLDAQGQNHDPGQIETATLMATAGADQTQVVLTETGPDTGVFAGAVPATSRYDETPNACDITAKASGWIGLSFEGDDGSEAATSRLLIDPEGVVFDSRTGLPVDGAIVTLIDDATGQPATMVYGDDGVSTYPNSVVSGADLRDSGGHLYEGEPGNFRFPLLPPGRYRLKVTPPEEYIAPSKRSPADLADFRDPDGTRYVIVAGSYGAPFDVIDPAPVTVDIPLDPRAVKAQGLSRLLIEKRASVSDASPGEFIAYALKVENVGAGGSDQPTVTDILPRGVRYRVGSARGVPEPQVTPDGRTLTFTLPRLNAGAQRDFNYLTTVTPDAPEGPVVNRATAADENGMSAEASANVRIHALLFSDALTLIGRVTEGACGDPLRGRTGVPGIRIMLEDGTITVTDRDGLYHFEGVRPGTHVVQLDTATVPATHQPVSCDRDTRSDRKGLSRFVEATGGSLQRADFQLRRVEGVATKDVTALTEIDDATAAGNRSDWFARATPGQVGWLFPDEGYNPRAPALRVVLQHLPGQRVALTVNGQQVDPLSFDGADTGPDGKVAISRWSGLPLVDRDNLVEARILAADGTVVQQLSRTVHYGNVPIRADHVPDRSRLVADGINQPRIAVRVTDRDGKPVRAGTMVPYRLDQPYAAAQEVAAEQGRQLAGLDRAATLARVTGDDGMALIALQPTTQAGVAHLTITLSDEGRTQTSEIKAWLSAPVRDWMVVGFGRGTLGYQTLSKHSRASGDRGMISDGQLALYAKGRIKGSWLLTLAYDSDRRVDRDRGALGVIDPNRYYTVYGDGSAQSYDAATRGKLYLRLERRAFYALFGDFETGFVDTRLTRYSRTLNGAKAEYANAGVHAAAFAARTDERYARDEIQGNGLSGPYRLSTRDIVANSDKLQLETRDRYRPDRVIETRTMTRHIDYDIDAIAGTIRFREPILSRDTGGNPVFIVVDYETYGSGRKLAAGARSAVKLAHGKAEIGATLLHDETVGQATLGGVDVRARLSRTTEFRGEAASGGRNGIATGHALSGEIEHHDANLDLVGYARRQEADFGTGQQNLVEAGTAKIGGEGRIRLGGRFSASGTAWHQDNLGSDARRLAGEARLEYRRDHGLVYVGAQVASDRGVDGLKRDSRLLTLGGTQEMLGGKVELRGQGQIALADKNESVDFPARQQIGATWRITPDVRLIGGYEIARGDTFTANVARVGFDLSPWTGAKLLSTVNQQQITENGQRTFAQYGLSQSLPLGKAWTIDATLDASGTIAGKVPAGGVINRLQPTATGGVVGQDGLNGDFVAVTLGAAYRTARWSWNGRFEFRRSDENRRIGIISNLLRTLGDGRTLASSINAYRIVDRTGATVSSATADLALAIRPLDSHWAWLERFQLRHEQADAGVTAGNALAVPTFAQGDQATLRAINNLAISYRTGQEGGSHGLEASLYHGAKYVRGRYADETSDGFIHMIGVEVRKDIRQNADIGINGSVRHSLTDGNFAFAVGPSIGFSPGGSTWVSVGYNVSGYRDRDFEADRYTRQGPYLTMRVRLDRGLIGAATGLIRGAR